MSDETRYFTLDEANALVPVLESSFQRMMRLRVQLRAAGAELERLGEKVDPESLQKEGGSPQSIAARGKALALLETLQEELEAVSGLGVQVKDLDVGLCDFVAKRDGRDVLLCWRLGEKEVGFWHEVQAGYAGRQPLK